MGQMRRGASRFASAIGLGFQQQQCASPRSRRRTSFGCTRARGGVAAATLQAADLASLASAVAASTVAYAVQPTVQSGYVDSPSPPPLPLADGQYYLGTITYPLAVSAEAVTFLSGELLVPVGPPGPGKKVQPGPRRSDPHKAARCCIDWAIKEFGPDGKSK